MAKSDALQSFSDAELLRRFVQSQDDAAFMALVCRHGPMVAAVSRRILQDPHAAEDAFQTTFLVLLRRAGSLGSGDGLARWLYRVAQRTALQIRREGWDYPNAGVVQVASNGTDPSATAEARELQRVVHEEIERLPEHYRRAVQLCYLQGVSYTEAARRLGYPLGTVASWLARAREKLRQRLARRGYALPAAFAALLGADSLAAATPDASVTLSQGVMRGAGRLSPVKARAGTRTVIALVEGASAMFRTKFNIAFVGAMVIGFLVLGIFALDLRGVQQAENKPASKAPARPPAPTPEQAEAKPKNGSAPKAVSDASPKGLILPLDKLQKKDATSKDAPQSRTSSKSDEKKVTLPFNGAGKTPQNPGKKRQVESFSIISLWGVGKVTVKQTGKECVTIRGKKELLAGASARVQDDTLLLVGPGGAPGAGGFNPFAGLGNLPLPGGIGHGGLAGAGFNPLAGVQLPGLQLPAPGVGNMPLRVNGGKVPPVHLKDTVEFVVEAKNLRGLIVNGVGVMDVQALNTKQLLVSIGGSADLSIAGKADLVELSLTGAGSFLGEKLKSSRTTIKHLGHGRAIVNTSRQLEVSILGNGLVEYVGAPQVQRSILGNGAVKRKH
jgi:RNA polymerase sigma factor (sigma-70 family)